MPEGYQTKSASVACGSQGTATANRHRQGFVSRSSVLVLDEATSARDTVTERAIKDSIDNLAHKKPSLSSRTG